MTEPAKAKKPRTPPVRRYRYEDPVAEVTELAARCVAAKSKLYLGIDPGITGAIAFLPEDPALQPLIIDLPTVATTVQSRNKGKKAQSTRTFYDCPAIVRLFDPLIQEPAVHYVRICLERGQPMHTDTPKTAFSVGMSYGLWPLFLAAFGLSVIEAAPAVWKRALNVLGFDKPKVQMTVRQEHPRVAHLLTAVSDHNRAEAFLLAVYLQRRNTQGA